MDSQDEKLEQLSERIRKAQAKSEPDQHSGETRDMRFDFVGTIIGSGVIGWLLDDAFATTPWFLIGMIIAGFVVGVTTAWKAMQNAKDDDNRV